MVKLLPDFTLLRNRGGFFVVVASIRELVSFRCNWSTAKSVFSAKPDIQCFQAFTHLDKRVNGGTIASAFAASEHTRLIVPQTTNT